MGRSIVTGSSDRHTRFAWPDSTLRRRWSRRGQEPDAPNPSGDHGWTLIELVVVMAIITLLASMAMTVHRNGVMLGKEAVLREDLFRMRDAIDQYYADKGRYPADLQALVTDGYLRAIPVDPMTGSADTWQTIPAEPDTNNPGAEVGVYNIKSGAEGSSMAGQAYSEW
jgi:general secretion pathway protein G